LCNNPSLTTLLTTQGTVNVAKGLLGHELCYHGPKGPVGGIITETEAYTQDDPASHSFNGKTKRNAPMFLSAGHIYIYFIYGMHHCLNIVTETDGIGAAVLIRCLQPTIGLDIIQKNRPTISKQSEWLNGPSKLMMGLGIPAHLNTTNGLSKDCPLQCRPHTRPNAIQALPRVGISTGKERLWRFKANLATT
jgi:DNA-3-methyladenine glycosylase